MKKLNVVLGALLLSLSLVACGGATDPGNGGGNPENAPVINSFKATPTTIEAGGSSTLSWAVTGATSLKITPDVGTVTGSSLTVKPAQTTEYTLTASNADGDSTETTTVTVGQVATQSIDEVVKNEPTLSRFEQILVKTGLSATLATDGPYTLFAPNDATIEFLVDTTLQIPFEDFLNRPDLADIVKYHIVKGQKLVGELKDGDSLTTLQGYPVGITVTANGEIKVEAARVIPTDLLATNGVVHIIEDQILQPPAKGTIEYALNATMAENTDISGKATFNELSPTQTEVVLELTGASAGTTLPVDIRVGNVDSNGAVKYPLMSVDGTTGKSTTTLDVPYAELIEFDGYINIYLSEAQPDIVVANGEIGAGVVPPDAGRRAKAAR